MTAAPDQGTHEEVWVQVFISPCKYFVYDPKGALNEVTAAERLRIIVTPGEPHNGAETFLITYAAPTPAADVTETFIGLPATEEDISAAAKAISPNPTHWKKFVPVVRQVLTAIEQSKKGR